MVSYYNTLPYSQKHSSNLPYPPSQSWFSSNYHPPPPNQQYLSDVEPPPHHAHHMYYSPHVFHQSSPDWAAHDNFQAQQSTLLQPSHGGTPGIHINQHLTNASDNLAEGLPSPPITVSGSEMSSPGVPNGSASPQTGNTNRNNNNNNLTNRPTPVKSPYYDWMKKPSYPTQPNPGSIDICSAPSLQDFTSVEPCGKTRTKDKYRVVYTDFQRLELEKEYHTSRYITIRRKTELAQSLQLSERQVKIWFQNRRAKERKQTKKREDPLNSSVITSQHVTGGIPNMIDTKPKLEPGLHLQHPLHQMSSMAMGMPPMSLHHSVLHHGHMMGVPPPPPPPQHLQQAHQQSVVSTGALSM